MRPLVFSNPQKLLSAMITLDMSVAQAAKAAGVDRTTLDEAVRASRPLAVKVAGKLAKAFGADVITFANADVRYLRGERRED